MLDTTLPRNQEIQIMDFTTIFLGFLVEIYYTKILYKKNNK